ncbi:MAG: methyltransferase domain-containing protein [Sphingomonadaceae bacterium]
MAETQSRVVFGRFGSRIKNPVDWAWDIRLGIKTFGFHPAQGRQGEARWYLHFVPSVYADLFRAFSAVGLHKDDVFVDLGSGLGRAVFAAAYRGARRSIGVEYVAELHEAATRNLANCRLDKGRIAFHNADATHFELADASVLFLFHPFGAPTMANVIEKLRRDRAAANITKTLRIIYYNPVCAEVLAASGWLTETQRLPVIKLRSGQSARYDISIWTSDAKSR